MCYTLPLHMSEIAWPGYNPFNFPIPFQYSTYIRDNSNAVLKAKLADPHQQSIRASLTPAMFNESKGQLEAWCVFVFLYRCVYVCKYVQQCVSACDRRAAHTHWHGPCSFQPSRMPLCRQRGFVWSHTSTMADMENIHRPVRPRD